MGQEYDFSVPPLSKISVFEENVRRSKKLNPITPSFSEERLTSAFKLIHSPTERDVAIRDFAIWVDRSIKALLSKLDESPLTRLDADSRLTSLIHFSSLEFNRVLGVPELDTEQTFDPETPQQLPSEHVTMRSGLAITAHELIENTIDAVSPAIRASLLEINKGKATQGEFREAADDEIRDYLDCAIIYRTLLEFWQKVLYGGYNIRASQNGWEIGRDKAYAIREAVGQERRLIQDENHLRNIMRYSQEELEGKRRNTPVRFPLFVPQSFTAEPNGLVVELRVRDARDVEYDKFETARVIGAHHTWIAKLSELTIDKVEGLTGCLLFEGWLLLRRIVFTYNLINHGDPKRTAVSCPVLQHNSLITTVSSALQIRPDMARRIVDIISHRGELDRDLWSHPSLRLANNCVALYAPALIFADFERVLNQLLKLNLPSERYGEVKGHCYEQHVREMVLSATSDPDALPGWQVEPDPIVFGNREFDLVIKLDQLLIIGEVKCSAHPADPYEVADRERLIDGAAKQGTAEIEWLRSNWDRFRERSTLNLSSHFNDHTVVSVVVVDGSYGPGFPVDETPVLDGVEIFSFIISDLAVIAQDPVTTAAVHPIRLYTNEDQAARNLPVFLRNPPLSELYALSCTERELLYIADGFFSGTIIYRDMVCPRNVIQDRLSMLELIKERFEARTSSRL